MTQQNAALVEQSTAAAESLKDQVLKLADVVGRFKLADETSTPARPAPALRPQPAMKQSESKLSQARPAAAAELPKPARAAATAPQQADDDWTSF
jgi:methyl-accepting chemotaxis protein